MTGFATVLITKEPYDGVLPDGSRAIAIGLDVLPDKQRLVDRFKACAHAVHRTYAREGKGWLDGERK